MPDTIEEAASLKALPLNDDEPQEIEFAHGQAAIGLGGEGEPAQLDIVWHDGRTLVYPGNAPDGFAYAKPWAFEGVISPEECAAWLKAKIAPPPTPKAVDSSASVDPGNQ